MALTRLLGYVTLEDFQDHLSTVFANTDKPTALRFLRTAEDAVSKYVGGRSFLPLECALTAAIDADDTTMTVDFAIDRFNGSGLLLIGDEISRYNVVSSDDTAVTLRISRGAMQTTAVSHTKDTPVYEIHAFKPRNHAVMVTPDYLELKGVWYSSIGPSGTEAREISITEFGTDTTMMPPYSEIQRPAGWSLTPGVQEWLVAAVWGYGYITPVDVQLCVLRVAEDLWARRGTGLNQIASQYIDGIGMKYRDVGLIPGDVAAILSKYRVWRC